MKIETINNKNCTELDVILLPTDKVSNIILNTINNKLLLDNDKTLLEKVIPINGKSQNIYFTSNKKPKLGEFYIDDTNSIRQAVTDDEKYWDRRKDYKKIEATTDGETYYKETF